MKHTLHLVIHGRVQGVCFRQTMLRKAQSLNIFGWVRNRMDGTVEAIVSGEPGDLEAILLWAHQGPEFAKVEQVEVTPATGNFNNFEVISSS